MFILSFAVLFRVLTLGTPDPAKPDQNVINGLGFMWNPSPERCRAENPKTWLDAAGQIFFTLSVGLRHHHQLRQLPAAQRRRRPQQPDGQQR